MRPFLAIILLLLSILTVPAQSSHTGWETLYAQLVEEGDDTEQLDEDTYELLSELAEQPIAFNQATREDLERIPFLSDGQIEELIMYRDQSHGMRTIGELSLIESLDAVRRALLPYFITLDDDASAARFPSIGTLLKQGRHTMMGQVAVPFYERRGDRKGYLGYPYRHSLRYTFRYGSRFQAGLVAAQDAGEPFFSGGNGWGYDHYSFYMVARDVNRHLKTVAVGRYRVRMGLGLAVNNDLGFGKTIALPGLFRMGSTIRAHSSRSSWNYLQGGAAEVALSQRLVLSAFLSWRNIDATLTSDGEGIATLLKTGYHRTESEMARKNNASQTAAGGHLAWRSGAFHLGATAAWTRYDKPLTPSSTQIRQRFYPAGKTFWNASLDYGYTSHRLTFTGETATGDSRAVATLNALSLRATSALTLTAIQRFYSYKYYAVLGQSFADGGRVQNESGVMAKADWTPGGGWTLTAYTDYAYFPWARYQAHQASHSWDHFLQATYGRGRWLCTARYRLRTRTKDNEAKTKLIDETTQRARVAVVYTADGWAFRTQADGAWSDFRQSSRGYMGTLSATWSRIKGLQATALASYFHTDDYASRIYTYERGLLYSFSFPAFYGKGIRYALFVRADLSQKLMIIGKLGVTDYLDRDHISSGLQQIDGSSKADLELQVRLKL